MTTTERLVQTTKALEQATRAAKDAIFDAHNRRSAASGQPVEPYPYRLYHGTDPEAARAIDHYGPRLKYGEGGWTGYNASPGFYMSDDPDVAKRYGNSVVSTPPSTLKVLDIRTPKQLAGVDRNFRDPGSTTVAAVSESDVRDPGFMLRTGHRVAKRIAKDRDRAVAAGVAPDLAYRNAKAKHIDDSPYSGTERINPGTMHSELLKRMRETGTDVARRAEPSNSSDNTVEYVSPPSKYGRVDVRRNRLHQASEEYGRGYQPITKEDKTMTTAERLVQATAALAELLEQSEYPDKWAHSNPKISSKGKGLSGFKPWDNSPTRRLAKGDTDRIMGRSFGERRAGMRLTSV